jgi:phosphoribosylpyrophosphate synthetase
MRGYKRESPSPAHITTVLALAALGLRGHEDCLRHIAGFERLFWAVVPSTTKPPELHPLRAIVARAIPVGATEILVAPRLQNSDARQLSADRFTTSSSDVAGNHVLVIDDSWVSGGHAQSVASALKQGGATAVSVLAIARTLNRSWGASERFERARLVPATFDYRICPWTAGECPG